jgi:hypothetical protein
MKSTLFYDLDIVDSDWNSWKPPLFFFDKNRSVLVKEIHMHIQLQTRICKDTQTTVPPIVHQEP